VIETKFETGKFCESLLNVNGNTFC